MRRKLMIVSVALVAIVLVDLLWRESHGSFAWYSVPGFFALFGLAGCVVIVLFAKRLGHEWLQKSEDYYEGDDVE